MSRVRALRADDRAWVADVIRRRWSDDIVVAHGVVLSPATLPGFIAEGGRGEPAGLVTYAIEATTCEIVTIDALVPRKGHGKALVDAVARAARAAGCSRLTLVTTNDNVGALGFYEAVGFRVTAVRQGAIEGARMLKPSIPVLGDDGVPITDEIELELRLTEEGAGGMQERFPSPDPITDPTGYQEHLLGWLGDDDPAAVQAATPSALRQLATEAGPHLTLRPEEGEWSAMLCMAHILDAEVVMSGRYRWVLAHDEPPLIGYDQDLWVDRLHAGDDDLDGLLDLFDALRLANVTLWQRTPADRRQRVGIHAERGPESYDLTFRMIAGHDRFHMAQARRALEALANA